MKLRLLSFALLLSMAASAQMEYKVGVLTPLPFNLEAPNYTDLGSGMFQATWNKKKIGIQASTGYLRLRGSDGPAFNCIPLMGGLRYTAPKSQIHFGVNAGTSWINEKEPDENFSKILYNSYFGWQKNHWSVDLMYFNWEEFDDAQNNLSLLISYVL